MKFFYERLLVEENVKANWWRLSVVSSLSRPFLVKLKGSKFRRDGVSD